VKFFVYYFFSQFNAADIQGLLSKFSEWVIKNNDGDDSVSSHVDNSVLLTKDGCADGCRLEGFKIMIFLFQLVNCAF